MWGDNLPHAACFPQCLRLGRCLEVSTSVSNGCKTCQIIIDASLKSISDSANKATLAEVCTYQSGKTRKRRQPWGLTARERVHARWQMQWTRCKWVVRWVMCACVTRGSFVVWMSAAEVLSLDVSKKTSPTGAGSHSKPTSVFQEKALTGRREKSWMYCCKEIEAELNAAQINIFTLKMDQTTACNVKSEIWARWSGEPTANYHLTLQGRRSSAECFSIFQLIVSV